MTNNTSGKQGEQKAATYLRVRGYRIIATNYKTRFGEIDIIAQKGGYVVFVEVKTRAVDRFGEPRDAVTASKRAKLISTAKIWLAANQTELQPRFDVIEIEHSDGRLRVIEHIQNAFGE